MEAFFCTGWLVADGAAGVWNTFILELRVCVICVRAPRIPYGAGFTAVPCTPYARVRWVSCLALVGLTRAICISPGPLSLGHAHYHMRRRLAWCMSHACPMTTAPPVGTGAIWGFGTCKRSLQQHPHMVSVAPSFCTSTVSVGCLGRAVCLQSCVLRLCVCPYYTDGTADYWFTSRQLLTDAVGYCVHPGRS